MEKKLVQKTSAFMLFCAMLSSVILPLSWYNDSVWYQLFDGYYYREKFIDKLFPICALLVAICCLIVKSNQIRKSVILLTYVPAIVFIFTYIEYGFNYEIGYYLYLIFVSIALFITSREVVTDEEKTNDTKIRDRFRNIIKKYKAGLIAVLIFVVVWIIDQLSWYFF